MALWEVSSLLAKKSRSGRPVAGSQGSVFVVQTRSRSKDPLVFVLCDKGEASLADALQIANGYLLAMGVFWVDNEGTTVIDVKQSPLTKWPSLSEESFRREQLEKDKIQLKVTR